MTNELDAGRAIEILEDDELEQENAAMGEQSKIDAERAAFVREDRYIVLKRKHLANLPNDLQYRLKPALDEVAQLMPTMECVVVESDWPEHPIVWQMIEARMNGASLQVGVPDGYALVPVEPTPQMLASMIKSAHGYDADVVPTYMQLAYQGALASAPTVKAERVDMADAYVGAREDLAIWKRRALEAEQKARRQEQIIDHLTLEAQGETRFGEPSMPSAQPVAVIEYAGYDPANSIKWLNKGLQYMQPGTLLYAQAPSLLTAGSAVEEVEVVGYRFFHVDHGYIFRRTHIYEGNPSLEAHSLMTVAQHERIVAALSAQQSASDQVSVPDTARLNFMLQKNRKVICERLPHDNFEVYVEEGFMGEKRHPCVRYSGKWENGSHEALEIKREAIDRALLASHGRGEA